MKIDAPSPSHLPALRQLWKEAFSDPDAFLDIFFSTAYSPSRCRCILENNTPVSVLYWLDHTCDGEKYAYFYAVATKASHQRRGLCRKLMEHTHRELAAQGYAGILLVPQNQDLARYYSSMGYSFQTSHAAFTAAPGGEDTPLRPISLEEYTAARQRFLPPRSAQPDAAAMDFLSRFTAFYVGEQALFAAQKDGNRLYVPEFLGDTHAAPSILAALGASSGTFCTPGEDTPFAMYFPLVPHAPAPQYLPFAFD